MDNACCRPPSMIAIVRAHDALDLIGGKLSSNIQKVPLYESLRHSNRKLPRMIIKSSEYLIRRAIACQAMLGLNQQCIVQSMQCNPQLTANVSYFGIAQTAEGCLITVNKYSFNLLLFKH